MKRLALLVAVVFAFAAVPVALADDGGGSTAPKRVVPITRLRLDILRLRVDLARVRYRIVCRRADSDRCTHVTEQIVARLTALDANVQKKLAGCSGDTKACTALRKVDDRLQKVIGKLSDPSSSASSTETASESGLDQAAGDLAGLAKP